MASTSFAFSEAAERALERLAGVNDAPDQELDAGEADGVWVTPPGSPVREGDFDVEFDLQRFREADAPGPVAISIAEALGLEAIHRMDVMCSMASVPQCAAPMPRGPSSELIDCPRCGLQLTPNACSGCPCSSCGMPPTPHSRALVCDQCGAQVCGQCVRRRADDAADAVAMATVTVPPAATAAIDVAGVDTTLPSDGAGTVPILADATVTAGQADARGSSCTQESVQGQIHRATCPGCDLAMKAVKCGGACAICVRRVPRGTIAYRCRPCMGFMCCDCIPTTAAAEEPVHRHLNHLTVDQFAGDERLLLLHSLRQLPEAWPMQPVMWVPRKSKQAAGEILHDLIVDAVARSGAAAGDADAEISHRLLRASGQLLFRPLPDSACDDTPPKLATAIRDRLRLAADKQWQKLVDETIADLSKITEVENAVQRNEDTRPACNGELSDATLQAAAVKSRHGSDKGACQILTGGPPVPPGPETDAKVRDLFRTQPLGGAESDALQRALDRASAIRRRTWCTSKHASRACARLRLAAGPGPSGFRNSYIALVHSFPSGPQALASWANVWGQASISPWLAELWTGALVRPFFKSNGLDVRPILCAEAMLKYAVGASIRTVDRGIADAVGDRQFGAGRVGGVFKEVAEVRAATQLHPDRPLLSLDIENAFGSVEWADALTAVIERVPRLAPLLAIQWHALQIRLWLRDADGVGWHVMMIYGSLLQGGLDGHPVFCVLIGVVLMHIRSDGRVSTFWALIGVWLYVDDILFQCPLQHVHALYEVINEALARFHLRLQRRKCGAHIPALAGIAMNDWPADALALQGILPVSPESLVILGTDAANDQALPLGPYAAAAVKTRERVQRACELSRAVMQLINRPPPAGGKHVAWRICRNVITHALDFDSRVLTSSIVLPHAAVIERHAWDIVRAVIGADLTDAQKIQVQLPTVLSGCQMPMPTFLVPLANVAGIIETGHHLRCVVPGWGYGLDDARIVDGVESVIADGIFQQLHDRGVTFVSPGRPEQWCSDSAARVLGPDLLRPAVPQRHVLSSLLHVSAIARHEKLLSEGGSRDCTRIRSSGGPNAGKALVAPAGLEATHFDDDQIVEILRWRLGLIDAGDVPICRNLAAKTMTECGETLDRYGDHAVCCSYGPLRIKRHDAIADSLSDMIAETGAHVRREAYVRAFCTPAHEAWIDIWAFAGLHIQDLLIDVTVRHPMASAYQPGAASTTGAAAEAAEAQKIERYPACGGRKVVPFAIESWGRLGQHAEHLLESLAAEATRHAQRRGRDATAGSFLRRWRATLDAVLQKGIAKSLMSARQGLPGRPHMR